MTIQQAKRHELQCLANMMRNRERASQTMANLAGGTKKQRREHLACSAACRELAEEFERRVALMEKEL